MKTEATHPLAPSAREGEIERSPAKEGETLIPLTHYVGARGAAYSRKFYHIRKDMILRNADNKAVDALVGYRWGEAIARTKESVIARRKPKQSNVSARHGWLPRSPCSLAMTIKSKNPQKKRAQSYGEATAQRRFGDCNPLISYCS